MTKYETNSNDKNSKRNPEKAYPRNTLFLALLEIGLRNTLFLALLEIGLRNTLFLALLEIGLRNTLFLALLEIGLRNTLFLALLEIGFWSFELWICFVFRASDFEFY